MELLVQPDGDDIDAAAAASAGLFPAAEFDIDAPADDTTLDLKCPARGVPALPRPLSSSTSSDITAAAAAFALLSGGISSPPFSSSAAAAAALSSVESTF